MGLPEHADVGVTIPPGIDVMALPGMQQLLRFGLWKGLGPMMMYPAKMHIPIMARGGPARSTHGLVRSASAAAAAFTGLF